MRKKPVTALLVCLAAATACHSSRDMKTGTLPARSIPPSTDGARERDDLAAQFSAFQKVLASDDKNAVVTRMMFPFADPRRAEDLSKAELLRSFDEVFSPGIRKQIALGHLRRVSAKEVQEAQEMDLDECGDEGDLILEIPKDSDVDVAHEAPDVSFMRLVFQRGQHGLMLVRFIGCS